MKRRVLIGMAIVVLALMLAFLATWTHWEQVHTARLENWIGRQIVAVIQTHVQPRIGFRDLHYQPPRTVLLTGLSLNSGEQPILSIDRTVLQLATVPRRGAPLDVQRVDFERPRVLLMNQPQGGLRGWTNFLRPDVLRNPESVPAGQRFSDILVLRHVEIHDGEVTYVDAQSGNEPMTLAGIELALDTQPDAEGPGWYRLLGVLQRTPVFHAALDGRINLDTALLELAQLELRLMLQNDQYGSLPPALQRLLREHDVRGELAAQVEGRIPLREPAESRIQLHAGLEQAGFAYGGAAFPAKSIEVSGELPGGPLQIYASGLAMNAGGVTIASVDNFAARLLRLPSAGEPLPFDEVSFQSPRLAFWRDGRGGFIGWSDLRTGPEGPRLAADAPKHDAAEAVRAVVQKVSLNALRLRDAGVLYEPEPGQPMLLDGLDTALRFSSAASEPDVMRIDGTVGRPPFLTSEIAARLNTHTLELDLDRAELSADLTDAAYASLTPQTRATLHGTQLLGQVAATLQAHIPLRTPALTSATAQAELRAGSLLLRDTSWPFTRLSANADWPDGPLTLTADNLQMHGGADALLTLPHVFVAMQEFPATGRPLDISRVILESPNVQLRQLPNGELEGWSGLLKPSDQQATAPDNTTAAPASQDTGAHLQLKSLEARNAQVRFTSVNSPDSMSLSGIDLHLEPAPTPGWQAFNADVQHSPSLDMSFAGEFNVDEGLVHVAHLTLQAALDQHYASLPLRAQPTFRDHHVRGTLQAQVTGLFSWRDPHRHAGQFAAQVQDGSVTLGTVIAPIQSLQAQGRVADGQITANYAGTLLGGEVRGRAGLSLADSRAFAVDWDADGLQLEQLLRVVNSGDNNYAGRIISTGRFSGQPDSWPASLSGSGTLDITDARLIGLPVIRDLLAIVARTRVAAPLTRLDQAHATFNLQPDRLSFSNADVTTVLAAIHGHGDVYYSKRLELDVSVSPLSELQRLTGRIGEVFNRITSQAVTYRVRGTLDQPEIRVSPLGL